MGLVYEVLDENRNADTLRALDVGANQTRGWRRSEFLSRGLIVEPKP